ncbi:MAG: hypothetical protein GF320_22615, partial [Armatimonadia bacterium]|nr:hypothetical protein [Armatimonadia bacterium]
MAFRLRLSPNPRTLAAILAIFVAAGLSAMAQAQYPADPEAAVVKYSIWDPEDPSDPTDGEWEWDPGVDATETDYYFDHDRDATDDGNVQIRRWGDHLQIAVEASLPVNFLPPTESGNRTVTHGALNGTDNFPALPVGVTENDITIIGQVRYQHESWTAPSQWHPCTFPNPVPDGDPPSWSAVLTGGQVTGIDWSVNPGWTHWISGPMGGEFWVNADAEPGSVGVTDAHWSDPNPPVNGAWEFEFAPVYTVVYVV